jgi:hypothetical protein
MKILSSFIFSALVLARSVQGNSVECATCDKDLIAGGGNENSQTIVGKVQVCEEGSELVVKYVVDEPGWCLFETHLAIEDNEEDIPQTNKGNPIPGQFVNSGEHTCESEAEYTLQENCPQVIAALAVVGLLVDEAADLEGLEADLPDTVTMRVVFPGDNSGDPSYFDTTILGGPLAGTYDGWCIDTDLTIRPGTTYTANVYSSYEDLPADLIGEGLIEKPENLDLVNYIINQDYPGKQSPGCGGVYTRGDVQLAIWMLIEDYYANSDPGQPFDSCRAQEIFDDALANGDGFEPDCGDDIALILVPVGSNQITIAQITFVEGTIADCIPTYEYETAWADGVEFVDGRGWATYFQCPCQGGE